MNGAPHKYPCGNCDCVNGVSPTTTWVIPGVVETNRCLRQLITARTHLMMTLHKHYKNGVLPVAGGLLDQPYAYFRAMTVIDEWERRGG